VHDFKVSNNSFFTTFFAEHDFVEGEDRLCWTMAGLNKLIALGLWKREFDSRGNLKSKPMTVEAASKLPRTVVISTRGKSPLLRAPIGSKMFRDSKRRAG